MVGTNIFRVINQCRNLNRLTLDGTLFHIFSSRFLYYVGLAFAPHSKCSEYLKLLTGITMEKGRKKFVNSANAPAFKPLPIINMHVCAWNIFL